MYTIIWFILTIVFAIAEFATAALVSLWFVIGSLAAMIAAYFGASVVTQVIIFLSVSLVCLIILRTQAAKTIKPKGRLKSAKDIAGEKGIVTEAINNDMGDGQVTVNGDTWTARSEDGSLIAEGTNVLIVRVDGVKAIVKTI